MLEEIIRRKRLAAQEARARKPLEELYHNGTAMGEVRPFEEALASGSEVALIAEVKRASPSAGVMQEDLDPAALARSYEKGGAAAISVVTEEEFFMGSPDDLVKARNAVKLPVLRKDFLIDEYQLYESRALGADSVLLIAGLLPGPRLGAMIGLARGLGMEPLVEVHTREELEVSLQAAARIIGINNRNLRTFRTDLCTTRRLAVHVPRGLTLVSESGIATREQVALLAACGVKAVLVGETLVRSPDPEMAVRELLGRSCEAITHEMA